MVKTHPLFRATLVATAVALVVMLVIAALVMLTIPGGIVVVAILLTMPDTAVFGIMALLLRGLVLTVPLCMMLLPMLAIMLRSRRSGWRWLLLPVAFVAGQWWGRLVAPHLYADATDVDGLFGLLAGVGGLAAAMVFARWLHRDAGVVRL